MVSEMEFSVPEIEAAQLINELIPLIQHSDTYQYVILVLLICLAIDKVLKKVHTFRRLWKTKHEIASDNELPSTDL